MAKRIVRLTENDLARLIKRVIREQEIYGSHGHDNRWLDNTGTPSKMDADFSDDEWDEEEYGEDDFDSFDEKYPGMAARFYGSHPKEQHRNSSEKYGKLRIKKRK